jgi:hypothetical protein
MDTHEVDYLSPHLALKITLFIVQQDQTIGIIILKV